MDWLCAADIPFALRLTRENGWNQRVEDWRRFIALSPHGCRLARWEGRRAGTMVCCVFESVAWLAMVMVSARMRGHGIGSALLKEGLRIAEKHRCATVRLDATPLGRPLYEREGFAPQFEVQRWAGKVAPAAGLAEKGAFDLRRSASPSDPAEIFALDREATRTIREPLLRRLAADSAPWLARGPDGRVSGFLFHRPGRLATHIGPACGETAAVATLLRHALKRFRGRAVCMDIPAGNESMKAIAAEAGLAPVRVFLRMCRGESVVEDAERFHLSSGPELG